MILLMKKTPICTECVFHRHTDGYDRCTHSATARPPAHNPVTGVPGFQKSDGDWTGLSPFPLCHHLNTLYSPCEISEKKEPTDGVFDTDVDPKNAKSK